MGSGSRKKKPNKKKKAHKPNTGFNPTSNGKKEVDMCNGSKGSEAEKIVEECNTAMSESIHIPQQQRKKEVDMCSGSKGSEAEKIDEECNTTMSESTHIPQQHNQCDRYEAEKEDKLVYPSPSIDKNNELVDPSPSIDKNNELVDPSPSVDKNNEIVDPSPSQSVVSVQERVGNDEIKDVAPPQTTLLDCHEPKAVGTSPHNSEINNSHEQEEDVLSTKSTEIARDENNDYISEEVQKTLGTNIAYEQGISSSSPRPECSVTSPVEPEAEEIDSFSETDEQVDCSALATNLVDIDNNGCCCCLSTPSPSQKASDFIESEEIKEMDYTSLLHHRNPIDHGHDHDQASYIPNFKIDKESNSDRCCIGEAVSELKNEVEDQRNRKEDILKEIPREYSNNDKKKDIVPSQLYIHLEENGDVALNMNKFSPSMEPVKTSESCSSSLKKCQSEEGIGEDDEKSPSPSTIPISKTVVRYGESEGAEGLAEFQHEAVDLKMEKATWKSCCGLFSLWSR